MLVQQLTMACKQRPKQEKGGHNYTSPKVDRLS